MLDHKKIIIDGNEFLIQQLSGSLALKHSIIIGRLFSGVAQGIESKGKKSVQNWNIDFGKMTEGLIANLQPEESTQWIKEIVQQSMIKPEFTDTWFDITFSGNVEGILELVKGILEHNYGGLLEYAGKKIGLVIISNESSKKKKKGS